MNEPQRKRRALKILPPAEEEVLVPLLTTAQVAGLVGCSIDAIRKMVERRQLPAVRVGMRGVRFRRDDIANYMKNLPLV